MSDNDFSQRFGRQRLPFGLDDNALVFCFHIARAHHSGSQARGGDDVRKGEVVGHQPLGMDLDLQLPNFAAKSAAFGYAFHGEQPRF